jgi:hypothetical protein
MSEDSLETPADKGQRSHKGPAILTKLLIRRRRYVDGATDDATAGE